MENSTLLSHQSRLSAYLAVSKSDDLLPHKVTCMCAHVLGCFNHVRLFATQWTVTHQAPLSMRFSMQEYTRVGCHALLQGIFPTQALAGEFFTTSASLEDPQGNIRVGKTTIVEEEFLVKMFEEVASP